MDVLAPAMTWPENFDAVGPAEDPRIVLVGEAQIEGVKFVVTAIRMRDGMRMPDYLEGVPVSVYEDAIDSMREEIETLASTMEPALVSISGGNYLLWMVPSAAE
jgi:hypothetical protein